jgi:hypothetical protein
VRLPRRRTLRCRRARSGATRGPREHRDTFRPRLPASNLARARRRVGPGHLRRHAPLSGSVAAHARILRENVGAIACSEVVGGATPAGGASGAKPHRTRVQSIHRPLKQTSRALKIAIEDVHAKSGRVEQRRLRHSVRIFERVLAPVIGRGVTGTVGMPVGAAFASAGALHSGRGSHKGRASIQLHDRNSSDNEC